MYTKSVFASNFYSLSLPPYYFDNDIKEKHEQNKNQLIRPILHLSDVLLLTLSLFCSRSPSIVSSFSICVKPKNSIDEIQRFQFSQILYRKTPGYIDA